MDDAGPTLQEIRAAVTAHLKIQADAEVAATRAGNPPDLLEKARQAEVDVRWCQAVEVAVAEEIKGMSLEDAMAQNREGRHLLRKAR